MDDPEIRRRRDDDLKACVEALATVYEADRYPARWPDDPAGWLPPKGCSALGRPGTPAASWDMSR
ncbi:hypothetical protein [Streptomyces sp. NPDC094144]|uniref:hypothetical protein n=1 Tax=Streptomyces sp. NPDC094144 TaxID=3366056 RepID=UPI0037FDAF0D